MRVRHAEAMAEFVQQSREVEAARLQPGFGPADVACVELGLPFVLLVGRAHPAKERRARARRSEIGDDLEVGLARSPICRSSRPARRAIRFSTLEAICAALSCQPGDLLEYRPDRGAADD